MSSINSVICSKEFIISLYLYVSMIVLWCIELITSFIFQKAILSIIPYMMILFRIISILMITFLLIACTHLSDYGPNNTIRTITCIDSRAVP